MRNDFFGKESIIFGALSIILLFILYIVIYQNPSDLHSKPIAVILLYSACYLGSSCLTKAYKIFLCRDYSPYMIHDLRKLLFIPKFIYILTLSGFILGFHNTANNQDFLILICVSLVVDASYLLYKSRKNNEINT